MSGTYPPLAALSPDNQGPANTIVAIVLCATSVLFSSVRYAIGRQKLLQFDSDDATFGIALCFGITMSVVSNLSVSAGLGQHQDALSPEQVERYFKLHWASQFLAIIALTSAKLSIVLMFRRILPAALAPLTLKILLPVTAAYAIICMLLIGFQCQPPTPWILDPKTCSSHGTIYYATTALNIATDLLLAVWILPAIWALQMKQDLKLLVMTLFGSRAAVCAVDVGRFVLVRRALRSADQTWTQLPWAILDQVIVHLSINHATLPRVHVFLSNLQTGLLVTQLTTAAPTATRSKGSKRSGDAGDADDAVPLSGTGTRDRSARWKPHGSLSRRKVLRMLNLDRSGGGDAAKEGSISESPLRLQPEQGIELSTTIYADCGGSTGSAGGKVDEEYNSREDWGRRAPGSGSVAVLHRSDAQQHRKGTAGPRDIAINVHRTVEMKMEVLESGSAGSSKRGALR